MAQTRRSRKPKEETHKMRVVAARVLLGSLRSAAKGEVIEVNAQTRKSLLFTGQAVDA